MPHPLAKTIQQLGICMGAPRSPFPAVRMPRRREAWSWRADLGRQGGYCVSIIPLRALVHGRRKLRRLIWASHLGFVTLGVAGEKEKEYHLF